MFVMLFLKHLGLIKTLYDNSKGSNIQNKRRRRRSIQNTDDQNICQSYQNQYLIESQKTNTELVNSLFIQH